MDNCDTKSITNKSKIIETILYLFLIFSISFNFFHLYLLLNLILGSKINLRNNLYTITEIKQLYTISTEKVADITSVKVIFIDKKYKKIEYVPVEYPSTTEIMSDIHELEMQISEGLAELEDLL